MKSNDVCRFCNTCLTDVFFLGSFPLAGGFLRKLEDSVYEKTYPLTLCLCENCKLLQCKEVINSDTLFKKGYFYYSSMIPSLVSHFTEYAKTLKKQIKNPENLLTIELGCNDGVFLKPLFLEGFRVIGIDPSDTVKKSNLTILNSPLDYEHQKMPLIYNDYFNESMALKLLDVHGKCDIFLSSNSFAHIDDMKTVLNGIKTVLKTGGLLVLEVHYSKTIIDELQFDFIYHEHMSYYTITSLYNICKLYDMSFQSVEFTKLHGTSLRVYFKNEANIPISDNIIELMKKENHLTMKSTYLSFYNELNLWKNDILGIIKNYKIIYGYGSCGRSNIFCNFLNINLQEIIDDSISKIGCYTPIFHQCIKNHTIIEKSPPDLIIVLAWSYSDYIVKRLRNEIKYIGPILIPLPNIQLNLN